MPLIPGGSSPLQTDASSSGPRPLLVRSATQKAAAAAGKTVASSGGYAPATRPAARPASVDPIRVAAQRAVLQSLAPLYQQLHSQGAAQDESITNFTKSLMTNLGGMPGQVHNEYANAIGQQQNLVDAAANSLRAANPDAQVQSDLQAIGAPQAQQTAVGNQVNTAFNGNAALGLYTNGVLPLALFARRA